MKMLIPWKWYFFLIIDAGNFFLGKIFQVWPPFHPLSFPSWQSMFSIFTLQLITQTTTIFLMGGKKEKPFEMLDIRILVFMNISLLLFVFKGFIEYSKSSMYEIHLIGIVQVFQTFYSKHSSYWLKNSVDSWYNLHLFLIFFSGLMSGNWKMLQTPDAITN